MFFAPATSAGMVNGMKLAANQAQAGLARHVHQSVVPMLEAADAVVYAMVGVVFFMAALGMLGYSVYAFPGNLHTIGFGLAVVGLVNDLLLVMIIMEVLRTVLSYLQERGSSLQPFLFIAAISATRRILAIGAQMSVAGETLAPDRFHKTMIDLGANAGTILAIAAALYLLRRHAGKKEDHDFD
jgi:uncharacterized membrane protein (DUF373 family)